MGDVIAVVDESEVHQKRYLEEELRKMRQEIRRAKLQMLVLQLVFSLSSIAGALLIAHRVWHLRP